MKEHKFHYDGAEESPSYTNRSVVPSNQKRHSE